MRKRKEERKRGKEMTERRDEKKKRDDGKRRKEMTEREGKR